MTVVIANFPEATPGCFCATCEEIREAARERWREMRESYSWPSPSPSQLGKRRTPPATSVR